MEDFNKVIFDKTWEFVYECESANDVVKKLNQWRHQYEIVFIKVSSVASGDLEVVIARKKKDP